MAAGHCDSLNLRPHTRRHLAVGQGWHEHAMSALKRVPPKGLRQQVPQGRRGLLVADKAAIDLAYWQRCRRACAVYFLSRAKANQVLEWLASTAGERTDPRNRGVVEDWRVRSREGEAVRLIC